MMSTRTAIGSRTLISFWTLLGTRTLISLWTLDFTCTLFLGQGGINDVNNTQSQCDLRHAIELHRKLNFRQDLKQDMMIWNR